MDDTGATRDDLKVPDGDVGDECNAATAEGRDIMVSYLIFFVKIKCFSKLTPQNNIELNPLFLSKPLKRGQIKKSP